jgi:hypothetical protein
VGNHGYSSFRVARSSVNVAACVRLAQSDDSPRAGAQRLFAERMARGSHPGRVGIRASVFCTHRQRAIDDWHTPVQPTASAVSSPNALNAVARATGRPGAVGNRNSGTSPRGSTVMEVTSRRLSFRSCPLLMSRKLPALAGVWLARAPIRENVQTARDIEERLSRS